MSIPSAFRASVRRTFATTDDSRRDSTGTTTTLTRRSEEQQAGPIVPDDAWYRRAGWFLNWDVPLTGRLLGTVGVRYESIETAGNYLNC